MYIPDIYQHIEYLESSGTQFLQGNISGLTDNDEIVLDIYSYQYAADGGFFCLLDSTSTDKSFITGYGFQNAIYVTSYPIAGFSVAASKAVAGDHKIERKSNGDIYVDGLKITDIRQTQRTWAPFTNMTSFIVGKGSLDGASLAARYKRIIIKNKLDLIPARRKSDSVLGMYDTVTGNFLTNQGTGDFIAGPDVNPTIKLYKKGYEYGEPKSNTVSAKPTEVVMDGVVAKSMKGNTVKWNQLFNYSYITYNISATVKGKNIHTVNTGQSNCYVAIDVPIPNAHKIVIEFKARTDAGVVNIGYRPYKNFVSNIPVSKTSYTSITQIGTCPSELTGFFIFNDGGVGYTGDFNDIQVFDLTAMGIADQINTVSDFETWLANNVESKDYYPYDAGSLLPVKPTKTIINNKEYELPITTLKDVNGTVMFPDGLRQAGSIKDSIDFENGVAVKRAGVVDLGSLNYNRNIDHDSSRFISGAINLLPSGKTVRTTAIENAKYTVKCNGEENDWSWDKVIFISADKQVFVVDSSYSDTTTFKSAMSGVMLYYELAEPITYHFDTHVDLKKRYVAGIGHAKGNTEVVGNALVSYHEYDNLKDTNGNVIFPTGMKKAGSVYDEIYNDNGVWKAIKRVGSVDLGSLSWITVTEQNTQIFSHANFDCGYEGVCAIYSFFGSMADLIANDKSIRVNKNNRNIRVHDSSYSDVNSFKQAVSGVMFYYDLATPVTYTIDMNSVDMRAVSEIRKGDMLLWESNEGYGVKINHATGECTRIGNMDYHKSLPIQSNMRRCIVGSDGSVRYVHPDNYLVDTEGNAIDYTVTEANGVTYDVMVEIPEHYFKAWQATEDGVTYDYLMLYPECHVGVKVPKHYHGAFKASLNRSTNKLFSTCKTNIVYNSDGSVTSSNLTYAADAATYRGGNNQNTWDSDVQKTMLGKPVTYKAIADMATYAKNRGTGYAMLHWAARNALLRLFVVEYATLNSQDTFNDALDANGYHQGGLGLGVSNFDGGAWNSHNGYYPLIPCGITLRLGSKTGVVAYNLSSAIGSVSSTNVPSYRGIESPFGDIWELCNGVYIYGADNVNNIFTAVDGWNVRDFAYGSSASAINGYQRKTNTVPISVSSPTYNLPTEGWITDWKWDSEGTFTPSNRSVDKENIQDTNSPMRDYLWGANTGAKRLGVSGNASTAVRAGLVAFHAVNAVGSAAASIGSRLLKV